MLRHLNDMVKLLGESIGVREMRKHLCWYTKGLSGGAGFRERVGQLATAEDVKEAVYDFFTARTCVEASIARSQPV
jgi:tRNA-dihydrouridine synthase B